MEEQIERMEAAKKMGQAVRNGFIEKFKKHHTSSHHHQRNTDEGKTYAHHGHTKEDFIFI